MTFHTPLSHLLEEPPHEQATEYELSIAQREAFFKWVAIVLTAFVVVYFASQFAFHQSTRDSAVANNPAETVR